MSKVFPLSFEPPIESFGGRLRKLGKETLRQAQGSESPVAV
mgnify:FL=1